MVVQDSVGGDEIFDGDGDNDSQVNRTVVSIWRSTLPSSDHFVQAGALAGSCVLQVTNVPCGGAAC